MKLGVRQAAAMLNVPEARVYRWVDDDEIPFVMIHQQPRFHRLELLEWAMEMELPITTDLYEGPQDQPLARALERGGGHQLGSALGDLATDLPVGDADRELIRTILTTREGALFVVRDGVALPRARSPFVCAGVPAAVGLWWRERAPTVFLIVAPTIKEHLQLLSRLSRILHDPALVEVVRQRGAFDAVLATARRLELAIDGGAR